MRKPSHASIIATLLMAGLSTVSSYAHAESISGQLRVGRTGILCVKAPCPWRGIAAADTAISDRPFWWGQTLPPMTGTASDKQRIRATWQEFGCLLVEGTYNGHSLHVERILEKC